MLLKFGFEVVSCQLLALCTGWQQKADDRPTFKEIKETLESMFADRGSSVQDAVNKVLATLIV